MHWRRPQGTDHAPHAWLTAAPACRHRWLVHASAALLGVALVLLARVRLTAHPAPRLILACVAGLLPLLAFDLMLRPRSGARAPVAGRLSEEGVHGKGKVLVDDAGGVLSTTTPAAAAYQVRSWRQAAVRTHVSRVT